MKQVLIEKDGKMIYTGMFYEGTCIIDDEVVNVKYCEEEPE